MNNPEDVDPINKRLVKFRESCNLSKQAFANRAGLDQSLLVRYEAGHNKPSMESLQKIVAAFPLLNAGWLIAGTGSMLLSTVPLRAPEPAPVVPSEMSLAGEGHQVDFVRKYIGRLEKDLEAAQAREAYWQQAFNDLLGKPSGNLLDAAAESASQFLTPASAKVTPSYAVVQKSA